MTVRFRCSSCNYPMDVAVHRVGNQHGSAQTAHWRCLCGVKNDREMKERKA